MVTSWDGTYVSPLLTSLHGETLETCFATLRHHRNHHLPSQHSLGRAFFSPAVVMTDISLVVDRFLF